MPPRVLIPVVILLALGALGFQALLASMPEGSEQATRRDEGREVASATPLGQVRSWVYQLQGLERPGAVDRLVRAPVDLFVLEPTDTVRGSEEFPIRGVVKRLHARHGDTRRALCLAYVNVGQAEDYRTYWQEAWRPAGAAETARKGFVLCPDPEGWEGNYPVAYWDPAWPPILFGSPDALVDRVLQQGFDGVYLDWVLGFADPFVAATAEREGIDPARAMADLVRALREYARRTDPDFLVVLQNPGDLIDRVPAVVTWVDGIAQEGLVFQGAATSDWDAPKAGGRRRPEDDYWSTPALARLLQRYRDRGLPVLTVDYAQAREDIATALKVSRSFGFVPCASRTPLDRLPEHVFDPR